MIHQKKKVLKAVAHIADTIKNLLSFSLMTDIVNLSESWGLSLPHSIFTRI